MVRDALADYLRAAAGESFDRRERNCMFWVADWVLARTGFDPAADWRGADFTFDGFAVMSTAEQAMLFFPETSQPRRGDVGVILTSGGATAAIFTGTRWAALAPRGLMVGASQCLKAWTVDARSHCLHP